MSHELIIYGYIVSSTWRKEEYRRYQYRNIEIISELPKENSHPFLTSEMFSSSDPDSREETFRRHILHFGASAKEYDESDRDVWISKFETLLSKLYWYSAVAHYETETFGVYKYEWVQGEGLLGGSGKLETYYDIEELPPTSIWKRQVTSGETIVEPF